VILPGRFLASHFAIILSPLLQHCSNRNWSETMRILLYNPDNGVTRNFMPHLWMFLLQALTPSGHEVLLIDGNAQPMDEDGIARYVREQNIDLVGIGAMTRMIASLSHGRRHSRGWRSSGDGRPARHRRI
jgi:hypothetical protein